MRAISTYHFLRGWKGVEKTLSNRISGFPSFEEYVLSDIWDTTQGPDSIFRPQLYWLRESQASPRVILDYVGRVETIRDDLTKIWQVVGLPHNTDSDSGLSIPTLNASSAPRKMVLQNAAVIDRIVSKYRVDFDTFGYSTDPESMLQD